MFDKDEQEISQVIEECLEAILSGQASLGDVLRQHSEIAAILQPELEAALWLTARKEQVGPRPGFVVASRQRVVERIRQESHSRGVKRAFLGFLWPQRRFAMQWAIAAVVIVMLLTGTGGIVSVSQGAIPGDPLYSVKRTTENAVFALTRDDVIKAEIRAGFARRRLIEVQALVTRGKYNEAARALSDFEREVKQAVSLLQKVSGGQAKQQVELANIMQADLTNYAGQLEALKNGAPGDIRLMLDRARDVAASGAVLAGAVMDEKQNLFGRATPTSLPTEALTPVPTMTVPVNIDPSVIGTQPSSVDEEVIQPDDVSTDTQEPEPQVSKTPKPTNENRPPVPPGQLDPSNPGKPKGQPDPPGQEDKPLKEDKPTKADKTK